MVADFGVDPASRRVYGLISYRLVMEMSGKLTEADRRLVESVRRGERCAEALFVRRYYDGILARACGKVGDPQAAADITQEVILGVLCALREGRLRSAGRLAQYVSATTTNIVRRHLTRRTSSGFDLSRIASGAPAPDELAGQRERLGAVSRAFGQLTEGDRGILEMTLVDGLTSRQVGRRTGMSAALVRQRKARALRKLRTHVSNDLLGHGGSGFSTRGEF
jgi:RNA polymerase sigma-70 factor (ECF subfamily)